MNLQEKIALYGGTVGKGAYAATEKGPKLKNTETLGSRAKRGAQNIAGSATTKLKGMSGKAKLLTGGAALAATAAVVVKKRQQKTASKAEFVFEKLAKEKKYKYTGIGTAIGTAVAATKLTAVKAVLKDSYKRFRGNKFSRPIALLGTALSAGAAVSSTIAKGTAGGLAVDLIKNRKK